MSKAIAVSPETFGRIVLESTRPVIVDFWAPWCGPCRLLAPVLDEIAAENDGRFTVAKVNVEEAPALMQRFGIRGIPALLFFRGGELRRQVAGLISKKAILEELRVLEGVAA
jgi:thioredoxin 1